MHWKGADGTGRREREPKDEGRDSIGRMKRGPTAANRKGESQHSRREQEDEREGNEEQGDGDGDMLTTGVIVI